MNKNGPILIIEDDTDDQDALRDTFAKIGCPNEVIFFKSGTLFLEYIRKGEVRPFLVLSDVSLPAMDGFEVRDAMLADNNLSLTTIPYIFYSSSVSERNIRKAFSLPIQGYFLKPSSYKELEHLLRSIIEYWSLCQVPQ